jgi:hypothetical protein
MRGKKVKFNRRRFSIASLCSLLLSCNSREPGKVVTVPKTDEEREILRRFKGVGDAGLTVDAIDDVVGLNILTDEDRILFMQSHLPSNGKADHKKGLRAPFGMYKFVRVEWRDNYESLQYEEKVARGLPTDSRHVGGKLLGNHKMPLASRIPDAVLDDIRKNGGGLNIKIRIHADGPLIGWDIERREALWDRNDVTQEPRYMAGGDFREAYVVGGKALRKGWYIHPKTGQKIETDY